jgi:uncharacterized membrane protein
MQQTYAPTLTKKITRWLVPLAAIIAFAVWSYNAPPGLLGKADAIGYAVCHRIDERSFHIGERQLPLCARCTGEFYAAGVTLLFLSIVSKRKSGMPGWKLGAPLILFFLAFGIDGTNSYLYLLKQTSDGVLSGIPNLYIPNNTLRLFTGSGMGIALAAVVFPAFNQSVWKVYDPSPALSWGKLATLVGIVLVVNLLILTDSPIVLYPIAYLSVLGVLVLLIIVFSMAWLLIMREENNFDSLREMWLPGLAGLTLALVMITVIDIVRFNLTGTWGGFPLG